MQDTVKKPHIAVEMKRKYIESLAYVIAITRMPRVMKLTIFNMQ